MIRQRTDGDSCWILVVDDEADVGDGCGAVVKTKFVDVIHDPASDVRRNTQVAGAYRWNSN